MTGEINIADLNRAEALMRVDVANAWLEQGLSGKEDLAAAVDRAINLLMEARAWLGGAYNSVMREAKDE